jgi:hypothetical protein
LIELLDVVIVDAREHVGEPPLQIVVEPDRLINVYITAARSPPRSEPANSHDFRPSAMTHSAALLVEADPPVHEDTSPAA